MTINVVDRASSWVKALLREDQKSSGEEVSFAVGLAAFPDHAATVPNLVGSLADPSALVLVPTLVIYLEVPGKSDTSIYISPVLPAHHLSKERLGEVVNSSLSTLRAARDSQVDKSDEAEETPARVN